MTAERLCGALVVHATHLPAAERTALLAIFDPPSAPCGTKKQADPGNPTLLDDIDAFLAAIDDGSMSRGSATTPNYGAHRTFGGETWTVEMRDLLERAGLAFLAGDIGQAREAYRRLLEARQAAWRAEPTLPRLLSLSDVATALDCRDEVIAAEADRSAAGPLAASGLLRAGRALLGPGLLSGEHAVLPPNRRATLQGFHSWWARERAEKWF